MSQIEQFTDLRAQGAAHRKFLENRRAVLEHQANTLNSQLTANTSKQQAIKETVEGLKMAAVLLQELVDSVASRNIERTQDLVNSALSTIFSDKHIEFRIISEIKRNSNSYRMVLVEDGVEGNLNSFGGGVWAVVAFVLKILFNILGKRYPLLAFDESLSFLSEKYIPAASLFIKELSKEFHMPVLLVTHQPAFTQSADRTYVAASAGPKTVKFTQKIGVAAEID